MLARGADVDATDENKYTPLMLSAAGCHSDCVESLIDAGCRINKIDYAGSHAKDYRGPINSPLALAAERSDRPAEREKCVRLLTAAGSSVYGSLMVAACGQFMNAVEYLIVAGANVNQALSLAIDHGQVHAVSILIKAGGSVNKVQSDDDGIDGFMHNDDNAPLHKAVRLREGEDPTRKILNVKQLLRLGAHVNTMGNFGINPIKSHLVHLFELDEEFSENIFMLLYAAGDRLDGDFCIRDENALYAMRKYANSHKDTKAAKMLNCIHLIDNQSLSELSREAIRKHLLHLDEHTNLFKRIPKLGLPDSVCTYMLYDMCVKEEEEH